jgi:hypothetical protein
MFGQLGAVHTYGNMRNHRLSCDTHFDYLGMMRLCISIASILLVTTPAVAAVITVREHTPDRPIVVVVEGTLAAFGIRFTLLSSLAKETMAAIPTRKAGSQHTLRILGCLH